MQLRAKKNRRRVWAIVAALALMCYVAAPTKAGQPQAPDNPRYLLLTPLYNGQATPVQAHAYAYGWFGAGNYSSSTGHRNYNGTQYWWSYTPGR
ncbi:MAG TPA: hypothetical protein VGJ15_12190 [Pirellulales bacterium]